MDQSVDWVQVSQPSPSQPPEESQPQTQTCLDDFLDDGETIRLQPINHYGDDFNDGTMEAEEHTAQRE